MSLDVILCPPGSMKQSLEKPLAVPSNLALDVLTIQGELVGVAVFKPLGQVFTNRLPYLRDHPSKRSIGVDDPTVREAACELKIHSSLRQYIFWQDFLFPGKNNLNRSIQYEQQIRLGYKATHESHEPRRASEPITLRVGKQIMKVSVEHD